VHGKQEYKLVVAIPLRLNLLEHCLSLLEQNEGFFVALLVDEVHCAFIQLVNNDRNLVCVELVK
jgi:hypothetical protein